MSLVAGVLLRLLLVVGGDDAAAVVGHVWVGGVGRVGGDGDGHRKSEKRASLRDACSELVFQLRPVHCMLV